MLISFFRKRPDFRLDFLKARFVGAEGKGRNFLPVSHPGYGALGKLAGFALEIRNGNVLYFVTGGDGCVRLDKGPSCFLSRFSLSKRSIPCLASFAEIGGSSKAPNFWKSSLKSQ